MEAGSISFSTALDNKQLEKDLKALQKKIEKTEETIASLQLKLGKAREKSLFDAGSLDAEKAKLQEIKDHLTNIRALSKDRTLDAGMRGIYAEKIPDVRQELSEQQMRVSMLQAEWNKTVSAVEQYSQQLSDAEDKLDRQKEAAGELAQQIEDANKPEDAMGQAVNQAGQHMEHFLDRVKKLGMQVFVFTLITAALRALRDWIDKAIKTNDEARAAIARLKGALMTLAQPLVNVIIPAFVTLVNILSRVVAAVASIVSRLFGSTVKSSQEAAKGLYSEIEALEGVGEAAKDVGKQMASFDEINQIGDNSADSGGGSGAAGAIAPDFTDVITDVSLTLLTSLGLLVIGAILTFTGSNVLLGIGMMALGAYGIYTEAKENPEAVKEALNGWLGDVLVIVGMVALVIGAVLAFSAINIPLGIFLIALGAAALFSEATIAPDKMKETINKWLGEGTLTFSGISAVIVGIVLAFSGIGIALGIGLIALGAAVIFAEAAINPDGMKSTLNGWLGDAIALIGTVALVIGTVLTFSGVGIKVGIALMVLGAGMLIAESVLAPDKMKEMLNGWLGGMLVIGGMIAIVLGAVLAFSGIAIPLGIALIVLGAAAVFAEATLAPDKMKEMLNGWLGDVLVIVGMVALVLGVVLAFSAINIPLGIFLIALGAAAIFTEAALAPDKMKEMLNGWLGTALIIGGIIAVVLGIILICTGVGLPLGIALLVLGVGALVTGIVAKWDFILEKLKGIWDSVSNWWNSTVVPKLTAIGRFFADCIINPLLSGVEGFINFFIRGLNWLVDMINKISFETPDWIPLIGGKRFGFNLPHLTEVQLPRLAQGAVIPPNREFMAVLGDQRRGTNIEAPADLIRQMVMEGIRSAGGTGSGARDINITLELDRQVFARAVYRANRDETQRVGVNLAGVRT